MRKKRIVLIGGGGHAKVVIDTIEKGAKFLIHGITDPNLPVGTSLLGVKVLGGDGALEALFGKGVKAAFITVGSIGDCEARKRIYRRLKKIGYELPVIIHPSAVIGKDVKLGEGSFVAAGVVINTGTEIGRNAIINTSSSIDHDCLIGDFAHIAPGAVLSGGVKVGRESHVGTGASVIQYLDIGEKCVIGAGVTVRHGIADGERYAKR